MIPKTINYLSIQERKPIEMYECIASWKRELPDYTIREWTAESLKYESIPDSVQDAIKMEHTEEAERFLSLYFLYTRGGIYCSPNLLIKKSLDGFLFNGFFGFYDKDTNGVQTHLMGAEKEDEFVLSCLEEYFQGAPDPICASAKAIGYVNEDKMQHLYNRVTIYPSTFVAKNKFEYTDSSYAMIAEKRVVEGRTEVFTEPQQEEKRSRLKRLISIFSKR
ncbi:MAG: hypothetical protein K6G51_05090 [Sphaerochaetaceae bacterium]|nr:hypothetical protein [Sphaerochaetaceae bacterium]